MFNKIRDDRMYERVELLEKQVELLTEINQIIWKWHRSCHEADRSMIIKLQEQLKGLYG